LHTGTGVRKSAVQELILFIFTTVAYNLHYSCVACVGKLVPMSWYCFIHTYGSSA